MKSICEMIDGGKNGERTYTVQISEGGRVTLSFDGNESNTSVWLTMADLKAFHLAVEKAMAQRKEQIESELQ